MKFLPIVVLLFVVGCSGSNPTAPTPTPIVPPVVVTPPAPSRNPLLDDPRFDAAYFADFAHGVAETGRPWPLMRLSEAPRIFVNTVDDQGRAIDAATLDTVSAAFIAVAADWSGGAFGLAGIERGLGTRAGQRGWITVEWNASQSAGCGLTTRHVGAIITFYHRNTACRCQGSAIRPYTAKHELGHAMGYWHTRPENDLMHVPFSGCDQPLSERERFHARVAYSQPIGGAAP